MASFSSSTRFARARCWLKSYPFTATGCLLLLVMGIGFCRRQDSEWEQVYLPAAAGLWKGEDIYQKGLSYLYPPFMAFAALPFLPLPALLGRLAWFAVNAACLFALFRWSWRVAGGGRLEGAEVAKKSERWAALLGVLCGISYLENCLAHQQTDIVIGMLIVGGCLLLRHRRPLAAATALGLAAACKCTALLWSPYLLWRGRPLAAVWVAVVAGGVNLLPDLVSPAPQGQCWLAEYTSRYLKPITESEYYIGSWGSDAVYNQSLAGLAHRWSTTNWNWNTADCSIDQRPPLLGPKRLRVCVGVLDLVLLGVVLWVLGRPFRRLSDQDGSSHDALEWGMVVLLMLMLSPMSSKAHFGTLVLPAFCLARAALGSTSRLVRVGLSSAVVLGLLCNKDPLGERLYTLSLWYGLVTWQTLLLLALCLLVYRQKTISAFRELPCPAAKNLSTTQAA